MPNNFLRKIILLSILTLTALPIIISTVNAAAFSSASILLIRNAPSTNTTIQVCATTPGSDNGTENNLKITFPTSFTVSTNTANWTVSTSNIPSDASAWPGIGTATNISGKVVTFPSSNLSTNTKYCFKTLNSLSLTTAASSGSHKGSITTYQGGTTIDTTQFGLNVGSDQIDINAVVPASSTDFEAEMEITNPSGTSFEQDTTLTYQLTYGSQLSSNSNITVEAQWSLGTISGSGTPTVEILDYVVGSASDGYNSTPPVIDTVNRKITWTINSFPASTTNQTVTFQLKTNSNYTGSNSVSFDVTGRVLGPGAQSADSTVTKSYLYNSGITPTPTPTSIPATNTPSGDSDSTSSTTPTPTSIITPTATPQENLEITNVEIREINTNSAKIYTAFNKSASVRVEYGTTPTNLNLTAFSINSLSESVILLENLERNTTYYFRIIANSSGETITSEVFTFKTSLRPTDITMSEGSFLVISNNLLIYDQAIADKGKIDEKVILPLNSLFSFTISYQNSSQIKTIQAFLRKKFVLSAHTSKFPASLNITLNETHPGEYTAQLTPNVEPGDYELYIRIHDKSGNIFEEKAAEFRIIKPFTVLEQGSKKPIEGAIIKLFGYNFTSKIYEEIDPSVLSIESPIKTLHDGTTNLVLQQGKYKAEITSLLFEPKTIEFVIGAKGHENYPTVFLKKVPFNPMLFLKYNFETIADYLKHASEFIDDTIKSNRVFELLALTLSVVFLLLTFRSLLSRTHNSYRSLCHYIVHILRTRSIKSTRPPKGIIKDPDGKSISKANVFFIKNNEVIFQTTTNINGLFFTLGKDFDQIEINKVGFESAKFPFNYQLDEDMPVFYISSDTTFAQGFLRNLINIAHVIIGLFFEVFILTLFLMEILFIPGIGFYKVLPYIILTVFMLIVFIHQGILKNKYI